MKRFLLTVVGLALVAGTAVAADVHIHVQEEGFRYDDQYRVYNGEPLDGLEYLDRRGDKAVEEQLEIWRFVDDQFD